MHPFGDGFLRACAFRTNIRAVSLKTCIIDKEISDIISFLFTVYLLNRLIFNVIKSQEHVLMIPVYHQNHLIVVAHEIGMFRFSHSKIYEAALTLVHDDDSALGLDIRWIIGKALWKEALWSDWKISTSSALMGKRLQRVADRILFVCADLLNHSRPHESGDMSRQFTEDLADMLRRHAPARGTHTRHMFVFVSNRSCLSPRPRCAWTGRGSPR